MFYISLRVITKKNHVIHTQRIKRKESKNITKKKKQKTSHHKGKQQEKKGTKVLQNENNKIALVSPSLSIIASNGRRLNYPVKRQSG